MMSKRRGQATKNPALQKNPILTPQEILHQDPSQYERGLFAFLVAALEGTPLPSPPSAPRALWEETLPQLQELMSGAVLRFIINEGGWQRRLCVVGERLLQKRIWEVAAMKELELCFGESSILACAEIFEHYIALQNQQTSKNIDDQALRETLHDVNLEGPMSGALIVHLLSRSLLPFAAQLPQLEVLQRELSLNQALLSPPVVDPSPTAPLKIPSVIADWGWSMPWLEHLFAAPWIHLDAQKTSKDLKHFMNTIQHLHRNIEVLVESAIKNEEHEQLLPVLSFFQCAYDNPSPQNSPHFSHTRSTENAPHPAMTDLMILMPDARISDRQDAQDQWGRLLRVMKRLKAEHHRLQQTHPADREPSERLFLAVWEERDMTSTAERVEALRVSLELVLK